MANLREIRKRIKSIKSTAKVTQAMQMVAATKSKVSQVSALNAAHYAKMITDLISGMHVSSNFGSPFLVNRKLVKNIGLVVIGSSRGFVGPLTNNLTAMVSKTAIELKQKHEGAQLHGISLHKLGFKILNYAGIKSDYHFADYIEKPTLSNLSPISSLISSKFLDGSFDHIYLIYPRFINLLNYQATVIKLLPVDTTFLAAISEKSKPTLDETYIFEPNKEAVLNSLLQKYFETQLIFAVLNSNASENAARMMSMKNATDNAKSLSDDLTLVYNKQRQAKITQQIIEISSGVNQL